MIGNRLLDKDHVHLPSLDIESDLSWVNLNVNGRQLDPRMTLIQGQCFNWHRLESSRFDIWVGVVYGRPLAIKYESGDTFYAQLMPGLRTQAQSQARKERNEGGERGESKGKSTNDIDNITDEDMHAFMRSYFQLDQDLEQLYSEWAKGCPRMGEVTKALPGVRVLQVSEIVDVRATIHCSIMKP